MSKRTQDNRRSAAFTRARQLAAQRDEPVYVVRNGAVYDVADDFDLQTHWLGAKVIAEVMPDGTCESCD